MTFDKLPGERAFNYIGADRLTPYLFVCFGLFCFIYNKGLTCQGAKAVLIFCRGEKRKRNPLPISPPMLHINSSP